MTPLLSQTSVLAALITSSIAASLLLGRRSRLRTYFAYFNINLSVGLIALFLVSIGDNVGFFGLRLLMLTSLGLPVTGLRFFALFLPDVEKWLSRTLGFCYPATVIFGGFALTPFYNNPFVVIGHAVYVALVFLLCFTFIAFRYRESNSAGERSRLRPTFTGGFAVLVLVLLDFTSYQLDWTYVFLANIGLAIYMYYMLNLILTARAFELSELTGKGLVMIILSILIAGIYGLMTFWVGIKQLGPYFVSAVVASITILILYEPLRDAITKGVDYFFHKDRELRVLLEQLRRSLINVIDLDKMTRLTLTTLQRSKRATHASFYLLKEDGKGYDLVHFFGNEEPITTVDFMHHGFFLHYLQEQPNPLVRQDLEFQFTSALFSTKHEGEGIHEEERLLEIIRTTDKLNADVCFPCVSSGSEVLGFICLKDERFETSKYLQEELSFMMMVAAQAAIIIENSRLFEKIKERDRLAALGEMSAGLAHEIRNPLGAIKGAAQLLSPDHLDTSEKEFIEIILEEVDRLNSVVSQFLNYARPLRSDFKLTDLNQLLRRTLQLLEAEEPVQNIRIEELFEEELPLIYANAEQIKQVLLNLIRNSIEAMPKGGLLKIQSRVLGTQEDSPQVELTLEDEGPGIPPEILKNIFIPFFTTKSKGTGLGLSICQRIIENHEGDIHIQNKEEKGARFTIRLPLQPSLHRVPNPVNPM